MNSSDVRRLFFLRHHFRRKSEEDSCWERIAAIEIWSCLRSKSAVGCGRDDGIYVSRIFVSSPVGTVSRLRRSYAFLACLIRVTSSDIASEICALIRLPKHCGESEARNREWSTSDAVCEFVHVHAFLFLSAKFGFCSETSFRAETAIFEIEHFDRQDSAGICSSWIHLLDFWDSKYSLRSDEVDLPHVP